MVLGLQFLILDQFSPFSSKLRRAGLFKQFPSVKIHRACNIEIKGLFDSVVQWNQVRLTFENTFFTGRLATYKYYNMDQVVAQSLTLFKKLMQRQPEAHANGQKVQQLQS